VQSWTEELKDQQKESNELGRLRKRWINLIRGRIKGVSARTDVFLVYPQSFQVNDRILS